ncbi:photosystem II protein Psb27 [Lusitaniella coriacea LEGE 07157]|uniref:Photosystem II lipoprotein Psb27 n=1 Tax=Lusitaniella coriacea LEGE 07157 TaxID=945747 RepID=A0A8J7E2Z0_9CYAN|nr:photosystem II protein Psb27 [Lusitaniella coriacea]MBE9117869.1 photosystem II protein Psb27 [Lusitaniella coriacea LEGE 07157]
MSIKPHISRLFALLLLAVIGLVGCGAGPNGLTGNYSQDTSMVLENLTTAIDLPNDATNKKEVVALARSQMNDYASRYRRNSKVSTLRSFTTMQTAVNSLAGFYSSYGIRPIPEKLKKRLKQEFKQVELALKRGA